MCVCLLFAAAEDYDDFNYLSADKMSDRAVIDQVGQGRDGRQDERYVPVEQALRPRYVPLYRRQMTY